MGGAGGGTTYGPVRGAGHWESTLPETFEFLISSQDGVKCQKFDESEGSLSGRVALQFSKLNKVDKRGVAIASAPKKSETPPERRSEKKIEELGVGALSKRW